MNTPVAVRSRPFTCACWSQPIHPSLTERPDGDEVRRDHPAEVRAGGQHDSEGFPGSVASASPARRPPAAVRFCTSAWMPSPAGTGDPHAHLEADQPMSDQQDTSLQLTVKDLRQLAAEHDIP